MFNVPFIFSSNGDGFLFHDLTANETGGKVETELSLDEFPSVDSLWNKCCKWKGIETEEKRKIVEQVYFEDVKKAPRYYQLNAINKTIEAIANGQNRIVLVMVNGTGKTFTACILILIP